MTVLRLPAAAADRPRRNPRPDRLVQRPLSDHRLAIARILCAALAACSGSEPVGENHACFRALDCEEGLVCIEGRCTSDIAPIVPEGAGSAPQPVNAPDAGQPR